jgi:glutamate/aspartate transport system substrate-binding protein
VPGVVTVLEFAVHGAHAARNFKRKEVAMPVRSSMPGLLVVVLGLLSPVVQGQTLEKAASTNKVTVGYREAAVPFSYLPGTSKPVGFSVDLTEAIVEEMRKALRQPRLEVAYLPVNAQNRIPLLVDGTYDLECGSTTHNVARERDVAFSVNFFYTGTRLLTKAGGGIRGYEDLDGKAVAAPSGSTNEKVLLKTMAERKLRVEIVPAKDYVEGLQAVEDGRAAALALDDVLLFGLKANARNPDAFTVVGDVLQVEPYGCMLRKDDPSFKALVDRALVKLMRSGEFERLYARWFESPIPPKGITLGMPMSGPLRENLRQPSDRPAQ